MQAATHMTTGALLARALPRLPWLAAPIAALVEIGLFAGIVALARRLKVDPALDAAPESPAEGP